MKLVLINNLTISNSIEFFLHFFRGQLILLDMIFMDGIFLLDLE